MRNSTGKRIPKELAVKVDFVDTFIDGDYLKYEIQLKEPWAFDMDKRDPSTYRVEYEWSGVLSSLQSAVRNEEGWKNRI